MTKAQGQEEEDEVDQNWSSEMMLMAYTVAIMALTTIFWWLVKECPS